MATTQVDELLVSIKSNTDTEGIDKTIRSLAALRDIPDMTKAAAALKTLAPALKTLANVDGTKLSSLAASTKSLATGLNNLAAVRGITTTASALEKIAPALKDIASVSGDKLKSSSSGMASLAKGLERLGNVKGITPAKARNVADLIHAASTKDVDLKSIERYARGVETLSKVNTGKLTSKAEDIREFVGALNLGQANYTGFKDIATAVRSMSTGVKGLSAINNDGLLNGVESLKALVASTNKLESADMQETSKGVKGLASGIEKLAAIDFNTVAEKSDKLRESLYPLGQFFATFDFSEGLKNSAKSLQSLAKFMAAMEKGFDHQKIRTTVALCKELGAALGNLGQNNIINIRISEGGVAKVKKTMRDIESASRKTSEELSSGVADIDIGGLETLKDGMMSVQEEAQKTKQEIEAIQKKAAENINSNFGGSLGSLSKQISSMSAAVKDKGSGGIGASVAGMAGAVGNVVTQFGKAKTAMAAFKAAGVSGAKAVGLAVKASVPVIGLVIAALEVIVRLFKGISNLGSRVFGKLTQYFHKMVNTIKKVGAALSSILNVFKKFYSTAGKVLGAFGKTFGAIFKFFDKRIDLNKKLNLTKIAKQLTGIKKVSSTIQRIWSMFTRVVIRKIIYAFLSQIKESFDNLAQFSKLYETVFNVNVSRMTSAFKYTGNAIMAAFEPILNVILPAVTALADKLFDLGNMASELFSAMTGQKQFTKAKKFYQDYAEEVEKANEKLKDFTLGIDELNILNIDTSQKTADSELTPDDMFERVAVGEKLAALGDKIKEAWKIGSLDSVGDMVGRLIRDTLNRIDWEKIQEGAAKAGKAVASFFNGLNRAEGLAQSLGVTIGEGVNTLAIALEAFFDEWDGADFGKFIVNAVKASLMTINWGVIKNVAKLAAHDLSSMINEIFGDRSLWGELGTAAGEAINTVFTFIETLVGNLDFGRIGTAIGTGVENMLSTIEWERLANAFRDGFLGIFNFLGNFVDEIDFPQHAKEILDALANMFEQINERWSEVRTAVEKIMRKLIDTVNEIFSNDKFWSELGTTIGNMVSTAVHAIRMALFGDDNGEGGIDFSAIGTQLLSSIRSMLEKMDNEQTWQEMGQILAGLFHGVLDFVAGMFSDPDVWGKFGKGLADGFISFIKSIDVEKVKTAVDNVVSSLIEFFQTGLNRIIDEGADSMAGKKFGEMFIILLNGISKFLKGAGLENVLTIVDNFLTSFWDEVSKNKESVTQAIQAILNFITSALKLFLKHRKEFVQIAREVLSSLDLGPIVDTYVEIKKREIIGSVKNAFFKFGIGLKIAKELIWDFVTKGIPWAIKGVWNFLVDSGKSLVEGIVEGIKDICSGNFFKGLGTLLKTILLNPLLLVLRAVFWINSPARTTMFVGVGIVEGIMEGIKDKAVDLGGWLKEHIGKPILNGLKGLADGASGLFSKAKEIGGHIVGGIKSGFEWAADKAADVKKGVSSLFSTITGAVKKKFGISSPAKETKPLGKEIMNGIASGFSDRAREIGEDLAGALDGIKQMFSNLSGVGSAAEKVAVNTVGKIANVYAKGFVKIGKSIGSIDGRFAEIMKTMVNTADERFGEITEIAENNFDRVKEIFPGTAAEFQRVLTNMTTDARQYSATIKNHLVKMVDGVSERFAPVGLELNRVLRNMETDANIFSGSIRSALSTMVDGVYNKFSDMAMEFQRCIGNMETDAWDYAGSIRNAFENMASNVSGFFAPMALEFKRCVENMLTDASHVASGIQSHFQSAATTVASTASSGGSYTSPSYSGGSSTPVSSGGGSSRSPSYSTPISTGGSNKSPVKGASKSAQSAFNDFVKSVGPRVTLRASNAWNVLKDMVAPMLESIEASSGGVSNKIQSVFNIIGQKVMDAFGNVEKNQSESSLRSGKTNLRDALNSLQTQLSSAGAASGTLKQLQESLKKRLQQQWNNFLTIFEPIKKLGSWVGNIFAFEAGGFPTTGQAFIARESGPEYVGQWGRRTVVANNEQIIAGIQRGVMEAMSPMLYATNVQTNALVQAIGTIDRSVNIGDAAIARSNRAGVRKLGVQIVT